MPSRHVVLVSIILCVLASLCGYGVQAQGGTERWSEPAELSREEWAWFPVAAVDPFQVVHVLWPCTKAEEERAENPDVMFYARWDGVSWSLPVDVLASPGGGYVQNPAIVADVVGNLHVIWSDGISLLYSRAPVSDAGNAWGWTSPVALASAIYAAADISTDDAGLLHVVYPDPAAGVYYINSLDGGNTWSQPVEIWPALGSVAAQNTRLSIDARQVIHVVWNQIPLPDGYPPLGVFYAQSTDGGQTWSAPLQVAGEDYGEPNILTIGEDVVHLTWHARAGVHGTFHQWSADGGRTWSVPVMILESSGLTRAPAFAVDSAGTVHLAAISASGLTHSYWQEGTWSAPTTVTDRYAPHYPELVVSGGNTLFLVWGDQEQGEGGGIIRYSTLQTSAPYVLPQPSPTPLSASMTALRPAVLPSPTPRSSSGSSNRTTERAVSDQGPILPIIAGVVPVFLLVVIVVFARVVRGDRR